MKGNYTYLLGSRLTVESALPSAATQIGEYTLLGDPKELLIPESFNKVIAEMGDTAPMFVTAAVPIRASRLLSSDSNPDHDIINRIWPEDVMDTLIDRIRESGLPGYRGHYEDLDNVPDSATLWLAATKGEKSTGERAVIVRGYVYDTQNIRQSIKTGALSTVSPMAMTSSRPEIDDMTQQPGMLVERANWLSLDWVRPNTEGIRGAHVLSTERSDTGMNLTPEQRKLIAELNLDQLKEFNPKLVSEVAKSSASDNPKTTEALEKLVERVQTLTTENATLAIEASMLAQVATILGCKTTEVATKLADLTTMQRDSIKLAFESAVTKIPEGPTRDFIKKRLESKQFSSSKEAEDAVTSEVAAFKEYAAAMGLQAGLGSIRTEQKVVGTGTGALSKAGVSLIGGGDK